MDHILAIWKSLNSIIGQLGLWIFAGAVGIGALFFGVGAAAGAAFAEEVGVAALVSAGAEMALEAAKAVIDLQVHDATLSEKEKYELYEKVADASIFLGSGPRRRCWIRIVQCKAPSSTSR